MKKIFFIFILSFLLSLNRNISADVIELKTGVIINCKINKIENTTVEVEVKGATMTFNFDDLTPYTVYRLKTMLLNKNKEKDTPEAHVELGKFCLNNNLISLAKKEFEKATNENPELYEKVKDLMAIINKKMAENLLENARKLLEDEKYEQSIKKFRLLLTKYPEEKEIVAKARQLMLDVSIKIREENEKKAKRLEALSKRKIEEKKIALRKQVEKKKEYAETLIEEGRELNKDALEDETNGKITNANKRWLAASERFKNAITLLKEAKMLNTSREDDIEEELKKTFIEANTWLVTTYTNLGYLWTMQLNIQKALKYLNLALAIDPTNKFALELKLKLAELKITRHIKPVPKKND